MNSILDLSQCVLVWTFDKDGDRQRVLAFLNKRILLFTLQRHVSRCMTRQWQTLNGGTVCPPPSQSDKTPRHNGRNSTVTTGTEQALKIEGEGCMLSQNSQNTVLHTISQRS